MNKKKKQSEEYVVILYKWIADSLMNGVSSKAIVSEMVKKLKFSSQVAEEMVDNVKKILEDESTLFQSKASKENKITKFWGYTKTIGIIGIVAFSTYFCIFSEEETPFPQLSEPKNVTFEWKYQNHNYQLSETLYKSVYDYYNNKVQSFSDEDDYAMFFDIPKEDSTIKEITSKINTLGNAHGLGSDQIIELATAFMQSIPYDEVKWEKSDKEFPIPRYPYQVLYDKKEICSGKSYLAIAIFKELGYGASAFVYRDDEHMAAGVKCTNIYSTENSGYCIVETTVKDLRIGTIPELEATGTAKEIAQFNTYGGDTYFSRPISGAEVQYKTEGKEYKRVKYTKNLEKQIETTISDIDILNSMITNNKSEINRMKREMQNFSNWGDYYSYNNMVPEYNFEVSRTNNMIIDYNNHIYKGRKLLKRYLNWEK